MVTLPRSQQLLVQAEYGRLVNQARRKRGPLTRQKLASLMGNAIFIVKYARTGKVLGWMGNYWKRRKRWNALQKRRQLEEFKTRPVWQRRAYPDIG
jgi:hypothetical protein